MNLTLKVWRQKDSAAAGRIETYDAKDIPEEASFLEMLDIVNEGIISSGKDPIHFDHDCREGICGMCSLTINGIPHGKESAITTCQLHMRKFSDGETIWIEPFRANSFPVLIAAAHPRPRISWNRVSRRIRACPRSRPQPDSRVPGCAPPCHASTAPGA